jgi:hypothetical protein
MRLAPILIGAFSLLAAAIAIAAGITLIWPGSAVDVIWSIRQDDTHQKMVALGWPAGLGLWLLGAVALATAVGSFGQRRWAWWLAIVTLSVNGLSDVARMAMGGVVEGLAGAAIAALILFWLTRPKVRAQFS